jgi:hypothetical protein
MTTVSLRIDATTRSSAGTTNVTQDWVLLNCNIVLCGVTCRAVGGGGSQENAQQVTSSATRNIRNVRACASTDVTVIFAIREIELVKAAAVPFGPLHGSAVIHVNVDCILREQFR